jgi:nitroreductase
VFLRGAPHLAVAHEPVQTGSSPINATIAASYFDLAAPVLGIGTCWAGLFQMVAAGSPELASLINLPAGHAIGGALMFGYPEYKSFRAPGRKASRVQWL